MLPKRSAPASSTVGRTRVCPHCKATILESAAICPQCKHHLQFGAAVYPPEATGFSALHVQGAITNSQGQDDWEYSVVLTIQNERGEEISRQVVGVGALRPSEVRNFTLSVDIITPESRSR
jgi:hypothetical protein